MSVRATRDGDHFHYVWAARRCLRLLAPGASLVAVTIEGVSAREDGAGPPLAAGEDVVDLAEYHGNQDFRQASRVDYRQLKHSTRQTSAPWTPSGLAGTLAGFGARYMALCDRYGAAVVDERIGFHFVSNRPIAANVLESVTDLATGSSPHASRTSAELVRHTHLPATRVPAFFARLNLHGGEGDLWKQADLLALETRSLMAGPDLDADLKLKALVTRKAGTEGDANPAITAGDVRLALRVSETDFLPAPSRLAFDPQAIPRAQELEIAGAIVAADRPVLVTAPGGVGKSVLATRLPGLMPPGSATFVYDGYGNGGYRRLAEARHPHKIGLVQITNEMATAGLCDVLLPGSGADAQDYMRGFESRLAQAVAAVRIAAPDAIVTIVIDAADNLQMAAEEVGAARAFVRDLLRVALPEGARLVVLYRPERENRLDPPTRVLRHPLNPFTPEESAALLRRRHPDATAAEALEFHRLSSANPRVQANALELYPELPALLRSLGPNPKSVDDTIAGQLQAALDKVRDEVGPVAAPEIDILCAALAVLRPLIPLRVLARVTGLSPDTIRSFAADFGRGRPLLILGDAIQFRDEPVEDWFRRTYRADASQQRAFVARLQPIADSDAYVAAALPALMLACGMLDELVEMALSAAHLPADSPLEQREIAVERLQFALRASLRARRWLDATKLATKAGEEAAGAARQETLLRDNPDLIGALFEPERLQELSARQVFDGGGWPGGRYGREAGLMSMKPELRGEALGRLRISDELLVAYARRPPANDNADVGPDDRVERAFAYLNLHGPDAACQDLMRWYDDNLWLETTIDLGRRLVDHGRYADLEAFAAVALTRKAMPIIAGAALVLSEVNRSIDPDAARAVLAARPPRAKPRWSHRPSWRTRPGIGEVVTLAEAALGASTRDEGAIARRLTRALPKTPPAGLAHRFEENRPALLRAYCLRADLMGFAITLDDLTPESLRKDAEGRIAAPRELDAFRIRVGAVLPWWRLRAQALLARTGGEPFDLAAGIAAARDAMHRAFGAYVSNDDMGEVQDEIALVWFDLLCQGGGARHAELADFESWCGALARPLYLPTLAALARKAARSAHLQAKAYVYARQAVGDTGQLQGESADSRIELNIAAARALFALDRAEAEAYLAAAVTVASKLGDDVQARWSAVLAIADEAATPGAPQPELAHRVARCAEFCGAYVDRLDWHGTIDSLVRLAPAGAVATVSRWRDREVTWFADALRPLVEALQEQRVVDPILACALIGFRFDWPLADMLEAALVSAGTPDLRQALLVAVGRYASLDPQPAAFWSRFIALSKAQGVPVVLFERLHREAIAREREAARAEAHRNRWPHGYRPKRRPRLVDWSAALAHAPTLEAALAVRAAVHAARRAHDADAFWSVLIGRADGQALPDLITQVFDAPGMELYDLGRFLRALPQAARARLAVQRALKEGMRRLAHRECWVIRYGRYTSPLPLLEATELSGLPEAELTDALLAGIADDTAPAGAEDLFRLVPLLARRLDPMQARDALSYSLGLIEVSLEPAEGDGQWRSTLEVTEDTTHALAGLIWGALGALNPIVRWQAAHVVRLMARFDRRSALDALFAHVGAGAGPFASPALPFYALHARQWLMLAAAQAARETPQALAGATPALWIAARAPQVLIRRLATGALRALDTAAVNPLTLGDSDELDRLNAPGVPPAQTGRTSRASRYDSPRTTKRFIFDFETARGLMERLANVFGISLHALDDLAEQIIYDDWGLEGDGRWDHEPRRDMSSLSMRGRHGAQPVESYSEYVSYHATLTAAGKLWASHPVQNEPDDPEDAFETWLSYENLSRPDGRWIADRRDPVPDLPPPSKDIAADLWPWTVTRADFDRVIGLAGPMLTVWGRWDQPAGSGEEQVSIRSVLVDPRTSSALLAATQTAQDPHDYYLPSAEQDTDLDADPFRMLAWVSEHYRERRLDRHDPWAAEMRSPPPRPADWLAARLKLEPEDDARVWRRGRGPPLFTSDGWATLRGAHDAHSLVDEGDRLRVRRRALRGMLRRLGFDLLAEVHIARAFPEHSFGRREPVDTIERPRPYFRLYLFRQDGSVDTVA